MLGDHIRKIRLEKKLSLSDLAIQADVSRTYLHNLEKNNQTNPSIDILKKIADVLEINLTSLLRKEDNEILIDSQDEGVIKDKGPQIESIFYMKKYIEELDINQLEDLKNFIDFMQWKRKNKM